MMICSYVLVVGFFFFFKQKTAYEMRISDWSSDVCSSDLADSGTVFFWAPVTGAKTANAIYPRSELRETYSDGTLRNWLYSAADNKLRATLSVSQVPSTGKIVIGQIHAKDSTKPMVKQIGRATCRE